MYNVARKEICLNNKESGIVDSGLWIGRIRFIILGWLVSVDAL
jgi:hypothetical protein